MVKRRAKDDPSDRGTAILVEDMRAQFRVFGEALEGLRDQVVSGFDQVRQRFDGVDARFDRIDRRLDGMDTRFDGVDARFDRIDRRLDGMDTRFDGVDARLERVDREIGLLKSAVLENTREIRAEVRRLDDRKVDREEIDAIIARAVGVHVPG